MENRLQAPAKEVLLGSEEVSHSLEAARDLRRESRELRADSNRLKLRSSEINKAADALAIRVVELGLALDRSAAQPPLNS